MLNLIVNSLSEYTDVDPATINERTNPVADLHLNSYDFICLIGRLESELGITIPERELRNFQTLGDLDRYLRASLH